MHRRCLRKRGVRRSRKAAKDLNSRSGYESTITGLLCALASANSIRSAAGLIESGRTTRLRKFATDNEILGMVFRAVEGMMVDEEPPAFELVPAGNFVWDYYTGRLVTSEHFQPYRGDRRGSEPWEAGWQKAAYMVPQLIADHANGCQLGPSGMQSRRYGESLIADRSQLANYVTIGYTGCDHTHPKESIVETACQ